jgi:formylglycine-generating enzyme
MAKALFAAVLCVSLSAAAWVFAEPRKPLWAASTVTQASAPQVRISGGWFVMGSDDAEIEQARSVCSAAASGGGCTAEQFAAERAAHRVFVRAYTIDRFEVSNAAYQRCVSAGRCYPPRYGEHEPAPTLPAVQVTFLEAREYCHFAGGELPSEAQWEFAAHGGSRRSFPWGPSWNAKLADFGALQQVEANPDSKSFFGLLNMAGNVSELVLDRFRAPYDPELPSVDPVATQGTESSSERVLRGGSWKSPPSQLRARARAAIREDEAREDVGFRCVYRVGR